MQAAEFTVTMMSGSLRQELTKINTAIDALRSLDRGVDEPLFGTLVDGLESVYTFIQDAWTHAYNKQEIKEVEERIRKTAKIEVETYILFRGAMGTSDFTNAFRANQEASAQLFAACNDGRRLGVSYERIKQLYNSHDAPNPDDVGL